MADLLDAVRGATPQYTRQSNVCATLRGRLRSSRIVVCTLIVLLGAPPGVEAQEDARQQAASQAEHPLATATLFVSGAVTALAAHEGGHLLFGALFDADPGFERIEFRGVPFFAVTHRPVSERREFAISSAGFWVQHAANEWLLAARPRLRDERAPFLKGLFALNVVTSAVYTGTALARSGPVERDTRGMAISAGIDERWVSVLVGVPAALDIWRYYDPGARLPVWLSRAVKLWGVLLIVKRP